MAALTASFRVLLVGTKLLNVYLLVVLEVHTSLNHPECHFEQFYSENQGLLLSAVVLWKQECMTLLRCSNEARFVCVIGASARKIARAYCARHYVESYVLFLVQNFSQGVTKRSKRARKMRSLLELPR